MVDLSGKREKNKKRLFEQLNEFAKKTTKVIIKVVKTESNLYTGLFDFIEVFNGFMIIQFNSLMVSILNNFKFYTQFELKLYCKLKSKYSKQLYLMLLDDFWNKENRLRIDKQTFCEQLDLNFKYNSKFFERNLTMKVIKPAVSELNTEKFFKNLSYEKEYDNSHKVIAYNFVYSK